MLTYTLKQCVFLSVTSLHLHVVCLLWNNRESDQLENHIWLLFLQTLFTLNHEALSSMQTLPHLLSFVLLLSFHHPAPVFLSHSLCQLKHPQTQAELTRIRSEKISISLRTWPASPPSTRCNSVPGLTSNMTPLNPSNLLYSSSV